MNFELTENKDRPKDIASKIRSNVCRKVLAAKKYSNDSTCH